jgi:hypothetical protein
MNRNELRMDRGIAFMRAQVEELYAPILMNRESIEKG